MKVKYIIGIVALLLGASCSDDNESELMAGLDTNQLDMEAVGGTRKVRVAIPGKWTVVPGADWVQVSPANGSGTEVCEIKVDTTILANKERKATVRFVGHNEAEEHRIGITQKGFDKALTLSETEVALENYADFGKRYFDVKVTSNVDFKIEIPEEAKSWISYEKYNFHLDRGYTPRTTTIRFNWEGNTEMQNRNALVKFAVEETDLVKHDALAISQDRSPEITPDRRGDSLAIVICERKLRPTQEWNKNELLSNWEGVTLWEESDEGVKPEMIGRIRSLAIKFFHTKEGFPEELKHLTYLETLSLYSCANPYTYSFDLGTAITELTNLKNLQMFSCCLVSLPEEFKNLNKLEVLDLSGNNFQTLPAVLTPENLPKLRSLNLAANRRSLEDNIQLEDMDKEKWGGFYDDNPTSSKFGFSSVLTRLFQWSNLERLILSNNIIKGVIPQMTYGLNLPKYTQEEVMANDTLKYAATELVGKYKILPKCKDLRIGLNYLHGELPHWIRYHPYLPYWAPDISIFKQQAYPDDEGNVSGFTNVPLSFDYYYKVYPVYLED